MAKLTFPRADCVSSPSSFASPYQGQMFCTPRRRLAPRKLRQSPADIVDALHRWRADVVDDWKQPLRICPIVDARETSYVGKPACMSKSARHDFFILKAALMKPLVLCQNLKLYVIHRTSCSK